MINPNVPDLVEDFAQATVIAMYDNVVPGGIKAIQPSWATIWNQVTAVKNVLGGRIIRNDADRCARAVGLSE